MITFCFRFKVLKIDLFHDNIFFDSLDLRMSFLFSFVESFKNFHVMFKSFNEISKNVFVYNLRLRQDCNVKIFWNSLCQFDIKIDDSKIMMNSSFDFNVAVKLFFTQKIIDYNSFEKHFASKFWQNYWYSTNKCLLFSFSRKRLTFA